MVRARAFEDASTELWHSGLVAGELHLGTGEEAVYAGTVIGLLTRYTASDVDRLR